MTKAFLIAVCVLLALLAAAVLVIYIQAKVYKGRLKKQRQIFLEQMNWLQEKQKEILNNAKQKKESLHAGSDSDSFSSSLDVLQNISNHGC